MTGAKLGAASKALEAELEEARAKIPGPAGRNPPTARATVLARDQAMVLEDEAKDPGAPRALAACATRTELSEVAESAFANGSEGHDPGIREEDHEEDHEVDRAKDHETDCEGGHATAHEVVHASDHEAFHGNDCETDHDPYSAYGPETTYDRNLATVPQSYLVLLVYLGWTEADLKQVQEVQALRETNERLAIRQLSPENQGELRHKIFRLYSN